MNRYEPSRDDLFLTEGKTMTHVDAKHLPLFRRDLLAHDYTMTPEGLLFPRRSACLIGTYRERVNGDLAGEHKNLIAGQGYQWLLNVALGSTSKAAGFYLALFANAINPATGWTAANFAATAGEITSQSEGYAAATRPQWVPAAAVISGAGAYADNYANEAAFVIAATTTLTVTGAALLSDNARGGTSGVLISASRYAIARTLQDGDNYGLGYRIELQD